jgi:predicted metalloprotease
VVPAPRDTHSPAPAEPRPSSTPLEPSGADEVPTATPLPKPTPTRNPMHSAMEVDIDTAVEIVDDFWHTHWSDYFPGNYESPVVVGLYDGSDPSAAPQCADRALARGNAFYCSINDSVQWDTNLMYEGYIEGDSWVYLVVAHEWGHAIQHRVPSIKMVGNELQADCLAGAALFGAVDDGTLEFETGDLAEIAVGLSELSDEVAWTASDSHGDAFERIEWFDTGRTEGVKACLAKE